jgi:ribosomal-protein-serine acetyltransferase
MTELGYWISERFEGRGLVITTCRVLIDYAFNELALNRIVISCSAENQKSRAIPEKLGFKQEGILRQSEWLQDRFVDMVIYGLLAKEWQDKKQS